METKQTEWQDFTVSTDLIEYPYGTINVSGEIYEPAYMNSFIPRGTLVEARRIDQNTLRVRRVLSDGPDGRTYGGEETWVVG